MRCSSFLSFSPSLSLSLSLSLCHFMSIHDAKKQNHTFIWHSDRSYHIWKQHKVPEDTKYKCIARLSLSFQPLPSAWTLARLLSAPLGFLSRTFKVMLLWYIFDDSLSHFGLGKLLTYCESHCSITPLSIKNLELIHNQIFVHQPPS